MTKKPSRLALGFLVLPFLYVAFLKSNFSSHQPWRFQESRLPTSNVLSLKSDISDVNKEEYMKFLLRRLVRGEAREELIRSGLSCVFDMESDICVTTSPIRLTTGVHPTIHLQTPTPTPNLTLQPYARKTDEIAMQRTTKLTLLPTGPNPPPCHVTHTAPALIFSTGGFTGNFFHDINDVLIPLFLTAGLFKSRVQLVAADYKPDWMRKYNKFLAQLSKNDVTVASSNYFQVEERVHCFPAAVVGVKYHNNLVCNSTDVPGGVGTLDFKRFLHKSFLLKVPKVVAPTTGKPLLVLISRHKSRALLNEDKVVELANEVGFRVQLVPPKQISNLSEFPYLVNSCSVLMGVHGAGLTNMVFLPSDAVVLQVVPFGLDWAAKTYYGRGPTARFGLNYVEYRSTAEESTLYSVYPKDHPVLTDPWAIHRQGYSVSRPIYTDGQNLTVDLYRLRQSLVEAMDLLPRSKEI